MKRIRPLLAMALALALVCLGSSFAFANDENGGGQERNGTASVDPSTMNDWATLSAYFAHDTALPPLELEHGELVLNAPKNPVGLGCILDKEYLQSIAIDEVTVTTEG